jgi:hypothetical protein
LEWGVTYQRGFTVEATVSEERFFKRQWLNGDLGMAAIEARIDVSGVGEEHHSVDAGITISDCNRQITLDFDVYGDTDDVPEKLAKIRRLRLAICQFERELNEAYSEIKPKSKRPSNGR